MEEIVDGEVLWRFDTDFLRSNWTCIWGRGCKGILDHPAEDYSRLLGQPREGATAAQPLKGLRIGLPKEFFGEGVAADVLAPVHAALAEVEKLGATLVDVSLPRTELAIPVYYIIAPAEASSNLSRFDGVKFGHRAAQGGVHDIGGDCRQRH